MPELSPGRRNLILAICCMSLLIVGMDITIVNVALPAMRTDLHASVSGLQWIIDAYTVVLASLLILSGSTADRFGRRRTFQVGLTVFTLGSLLCSVAPGLGWLIAFRMLQAVGGSMLNPVAMSIITNVFTEPRERARAIGFYAGAVGVSLGLGPVLGGILVETIGWRSIFWINVPIGIAAFVLAGLFIPESKAERARRVDPVGQVLVIVVLLTLTYAIIEAPRAGDSWGTWACGILCVAAFVALLRYESRRDEPLIQLTFFRSVPFAGASVMGVCAVGAFSAFLFLNTLYLQDVRGLSPLRAGLLMLPLAVMTVIFAPISGRLVGSLGPRLPLTISGAAMMVGVLPLTGLTDDVSYGWLLVCTVIFGLGMGMVNPPITNAAVSGMPRAQAGVAAAFASTSRQVGSSLGIAVAGAIVSAGAGANARTEFSQASHAAWWVVVGCSAAVLLLALATTGQRAKRTTHHVAELLDA
ncbi:MFS transporter [Luteipulveratus mongoliensis]|uniref:MFS transporter n=1 Tax=Luteipulveratus mongoliensis TaxID=571913 RepID=A0A0K1JFF9_9MICO|nr:MFS transporter [Luteipulveratus mongoliensis]AKU15444.1 MFS transporter [Luteipulveratus mongoliensis]